MRNVKCLPLLSDQDRHHSIPNHNFIRRNLLRHGKALSGTNVKLPAMPLTLNDMVAKRALGQRRAFVGTEVFAGIKFAIDVVESEFTPSRKFNCLASSLR